MDETNYYCKNALCYVVERLAFGFWALRFVYFIFITFHEMIIHIQRPGYDITYILSKLFMLRPTKLSLSLFHTHSLFSKLSNKWLCCNARHTTLHHRNAMNQQFNAKMRMNCCEMKNKDGNDTMKMRRGTKNN